MVFSIRKGAAVVYQDIVPEKMLAEPVELASFEIEASLVSIFSTKDLDLGGVEHGILVGGLDHAIELGVAAYADAIDDFAVGKDARGLERLGAVCVAAIELTLAVIEIILEIPVKHLADPVLTGNQPSLAVHLVFS